MPIDPPNPNRPRLLFSLLLLASAFDGAIMGILLLQETIAKKALGATDFQVALIGVLANVTMVLSFFVTQFYANRSKKWLLFGGYFFGRFIFLFSYLITGVPIFLLFIFLYNAVYAVQLPVTNNFFQHHFKARCGLTFGAYRAVLVLFSTLASLYAGRLLDRAPTAYRPILLSIALGAAVTYAVYFLLEARIDYPAPAGRARGDFRAALARIVGNRDFILFEGLFMLYGLAFMILTPTVPLFLLDRLKLTYFEMGQARGLYAQAAIVLAVPLAGRLYDRLDPWRTAALSFGLLAVYPVLLIVSFYTLAKPLAYAALILFSVGMSGVTILWNIASIKFARGEDSSVYQGFHVTLVGVRGVFGPLLGYFLLARFSAVAAFIAAGAFFALAAAGNLLQGRKAAAPFRPAGIPVD